MEPLCDASVMFSDDLVVLSPLFGLVSDSVHGGSHSWLDVAVEFAAGKQAYTRGLPGLAATGSRSSSGLSLDRCVALWLPCGTLAIPLVPVREEEFVYCYFVTRPLY